VAEAAKLLVAAENPVLIPTVARARPPG